MAASKGYQSQFIDSVFDDLYCKKCTLVARRLTITNCCGESFCHTCIADKQEQGNPCPACGEKNFTTFEHVKSQKRINCLRVYCSMKERGCDWSGTLEQLDTHLDPDQDNCQYVDTKCPLNCQQSIPRNKVEQHVAQQCAKRPYVCQHCNFKATYEEVVDAHLPECKYVPLQCPNLCGVTFERDFMENHMKTCRLEEVWCEFSGVGCDDRFRREDQKEHTRQNSQIHLTLTASLAVETKEQLQQKYEKHKVEREKLKQKVEEENAKVDIKLQNQHQKHMEVEEKLRQKVQELEKKTENKLEEQGKKLRKKLEEEERKLNDQDKKLKEQEKKLKEQEKKIEDLNKAHKAQKLELDEQKLLLQQHFNSKLQGLEQMLKEVVDKSIRNEGKLSEISSTVYLNRKFKMKNFSHEKAKDMTNDWKSPAMYTQVCGYKFCIGVDANGHGSGHGKGISVSLLAMIGEFDIQLKWPARIKFTIELINQQGGENASWIFGPLQWSKPIVEYCIGRVDLFLRHSALKSFLNIDTLHFHVSKIITPSYW